MGLETGDTIAALNASWPLGTDNVSQGDDHLRLIKSVCKNDVVSKAVGGTINGNLTIEKTAPNVIYQDTSLPATEQSYGSGVDGNGDYTIQARFDDGSFESTLYTFKRDAQMSSASAVPRRDTGDARWARIDVANTFPATQAISNTIPIFNLFELDNAGLGFSMRQSAGDLYFSTLSAAGAVQQNVYIMDRAGGMSTAATIPTRSSGDNRWVLKTAMAELVNALVASNTITQTTADVILGA